MVALSMADWTLTPSVLCWLKLDTASRAPGGGDWTA
jgi:hypothetical protein